MALSEDFGTWFTDILCLCYKNVDGYHFSANLNPEKALDPFGLCCGKRSAVQCCFLSEPALGSEFSSQIPLWQQWLPRSCVGSLKQTADWAGLPWVGGVCQKATLSLSKPQR